MLLRFGSLPGDLFGIKEWKSSADEMTEKFSNFQINRFKESFDPTKEPENLICAYLLEIHEKGGWDTHKLRRAKFDLIWHGGIEHNHHLVRVVLPSPPRGSGENLSGNQNSLGYRTSAEEVRHAKTALSQCCDQRHSGLVE